MNHPDVPGLTNVDDKKFIAALIADVRSIETEAEEMRLRLLVIRTVCREALDRFEKHYGGLNGNSH